MPYRERLPVHGQLVVAFGQWPRHGFDLIASVSGYAGSARHFQRRHRTIRLVALAANDSGEADMLFDG